MKKRFIWVALAICGAPLMVPAHAEEAAQAGGKVAALERVVVESPTLAGKLDALLQIADLNAQTPAATPDETRALWNRIGEVARLMAPRLVRGRPKSEAVPGDYALTRALFERIASAPDAPSDLFVVALRSLAQSAVKDGDFAAAVRHYERLAGDARADILTRAAAFREVGKVSRLSKPATRAPVKADDLDAPKRAAKPKTAPAPKLGPANEQSEVAYAAALALYRQLLDDVATPPEQKAAAYDGLLQTYASQFDRRRAEQEANALYEPMRAPLLKLFDPAKNSVLVTPEARREAALPLYRAADGLTLYLPARDGLAIKEGLGELLLGAGQYEAARAQLEGIYSLRIPTNLSQQSSPDAKYLDGAARRAIALSLKLQGEASGDAAMLRNARDKYEQLLADASLETRVFAAALTDLNSLAPTPLAIALPANSPLAIAADGTSDLPPAVLPPAVLPILNVPVSATYDEASSRGGSLLERDQFYRASQQVMRALELAKTDGEKVRQLTRLSYVELKSSHFDRSVQRANQARELLPSLLGDAQVTDNDKAVALTRLARVYRDLGDFPRSLALLRRILELKGQGKGVDADLIGATELEIASVLLETERYEETRASLLRLIEKPGTNDGLYSAARLVIVFTYLNADQNDEAMREIAALMKDERVSALWRAQAQRFNGKIFVKREAYADARDVFQISLKLFDEAIAAGQTSPRNKGELYLDIVKTYEKEFDAQRAAQEAGALGSGVWQEADKLRRSGTHARAVERYEELKPLLPYVAGESSLLARLGYGESLMQTARYEEARAQFRVILQLNASEDASQQTRDALANYQNYARRYFAQSFASQTQYDEGGAQAFIRAREEFVKLLATPDLPADMRAFIQQQLDRLNNGFNDAPAA